VTLTNLDLDTLRTLVVAHDLGGYGQAAARLGRTASAVSLQMKRLQENVGAQLFRKNGRTLALTEEGETVLRYSRRILALNDELLHTIRGASLAGTLRLGCSQDFSENVLPDVLAEFKALHPQVQIEVRIEGNRALADGVEKDQLDLALAVGQAQRPAAETLGHLELVWIAARDFSRREDGSLPLVLFGQHCAFRKVALEKLDEAGVPWRVAAVSPSSSGLWASVLAGIGMTARGALGVPAGLVWKKKLFGLPALGSLPVTLHSRRGAQYPGAEPLRAMIHAAVGKVLRA
jgi:DNA-binding transcriptional LysR family regulator